MFHFLLQYIQTLPPQSLQLELLQLESLQLELLQQELLLFVLVPHLLQYFLHLPMNLKHLQLRFQMLVLLPQLIFEQGQLVHLIIQLLYLLNHSLKFSSVGSIDFFICPLCHLLDLNSTISVSTSIIAKNHFFNCCHFTRTN